jgi:hypothetical protein
MDYLPMNQESSHKTWYIVGVIVVVLAALALSYYYLQVPKSSDTSYDQTSQNLAPAPQGGVAAELNATLSQTSDGSGTLEADQAAAANAVSGF